jgi:hypothetical protein
MNQETEVFRGPLTDIEWNELLLDAAFHEWQLIGENIEDWQVTTDYELCTLKQGE